MSTSALSPVLEPPPPRARPASSLRTQPPTLAQWIETLGAASCRDCVPVADLADPNLAFRVLEAGEREQTFLKVLRTLRQPLERSGDHRKSRWASGWQENLDEFIASGHDLSTLKPKFMRAGEVMRWGREYIQPATDRLEPALVAVLQKFLFRRYFAGCDAVYEFGAGTGHNMVALAQQFPHIDIHALDWVEPSVRIIDLLREKYGFRMQGHLFDLTSPDPSITLAPNSGVMTMGALEQLGDRFQPFLDFLIARGPAVCVHAETLHELYDQDTLFDWLGAQYLEKRGYLFGFLAALRRLEAAGQVEILAVKRTFGSLYHDGYSYLVWRPVRRA